MADGSATTPRPYWASETDAQKFVSRCLERYAWHMQALKASGRWGSMRSILSAYYGNGVDGESDTGDLQESGDDGETIAMSTNQVRPVVANTLSLIVGQWPETKPRAVNESAKALAEARLAAALDKHYEDRTSGQARIIDTVRGALLASSWTIGHAWAPQDGKEWALNETGQPVYEGDIQTFVLPPWRCAWDFSAGDEDSRKWVLFRRPVSRFDAAANAEATQPEVAEKLRRSSDVASSAWARVIGQRGVADMRNLDALLGETLPDEDVLWVWELRHLPTPALPQGRLVRFVEPDIILFDSLALGTRYPYEDKELHVREYCPERVVAGGAGHTGAFDLGALQRFIDLCTASIATTVNVNGQMRFWGGPGTDGGGAGAQVRALGLNGAVIDSAQEPKALNFPALKPEVVEAADWAIAQGNASMALNNVVRGQPDKGMPAQAMALLKASAIQYHAVAQGDFVRLVKWAANSRLRLLKRFARSPRVAQLVGKGRAYELKEWSEKDINDVAGFDVEAVNPAFNTFESRSVMADFMAQRGWIGREQYIAFVQTGSLEQGLEVDRAKSELVESNMDLLRKGVGLPPVDMARMDAEMQAHAQASVQAQTMGAPPPPKPIPVFLDTPKGEPVVRILKSDPHHIAIPAYLSLVTSPSTRGDAKMLRVALEAAQYSLQLWQSLTPDECAVYGLPPLPSQMAAAMPPGAPSAPPPGGAPPPGDEPTGAPSGEGMPEEGDIKQPEDPTTGQPVPGAPIPK